MNKIAVIYKSTYGHTKQYAEWIAAKLRADLIEQKTAKAATLNQYETIIYGGSIYASMINGIDLVAKNPCKRLVVFTVGLTDSTTMGDSPIIDRAFANSPSRPQAVFHFRGGLKADELGFIHRNLLKILRKSVAKKSTSELNAVEKVIKDISGNNIDYTDQESIEPLVRYVNNG